MWKYISAAGSYLYNWITGQSQTRPDRSLYTPINDPEDGAPEEAGREDPQPPRNTRPPKYKRTLLKLMTLSALALDSIFIVFLYNAMKSALLYTMDEFDESSETLQTSFLIAFGGMVSFNLIAELLIINPVEEAEAMAGSKIAGFIGDIEGDNLCDKITSSSLAVFNQIVAQPTYVIGAAADAVSIAYLTSQGWLKWGYGVPVTMLGVVYYNLLMRTPINRHAKEFIHKFLNCQESIFINTLKTPAKSLEVLIQTLSNAIYRSVSMGYIMDQILVELFNQGSDNQDNTYYIAFAFFFTFYISLFSRTLNVRDKVLNPKFDTIPQEMLKTTKVSKIGSCIDVLMTTLRAGPASVIIYRHGFDSQIANIMLSGSIGVTLMLQGLYVRYKTRLHQTALENIERGVPKESTEPRSAEEVFEMLKKQNKTKGLTVVATGLNVCSRASKSVAFLGFLAVLNDALISNGINLQLDFWDILCVHQLWGNTNFENELSFFQQAIQENLAYHITKCKIAIKQSKPAISVITSFWKSKEDYSLSTLSDADLLQQEQPCPPK
ncbi:MAG: hypothetical protein KAT71_02310 [Gammaproteobacteria bacterium]|nr:hypothetical protein [Gammaproteobacteria bacterium]